ncbi:hypothetical protein V8F33_008275 [Rhypophila sp. PSN 637]
MAPPQNWAGLPRLKWPPLADASQPSITPVLHAETTSHLYHAPTYAFTLHNPMDSTNTNETEANISFLTSAPVVNQIHRILIEADFPAPIVDEPESRSMDILFGNWFKPSFCKCDVGMLDAISARATSLERLEIMYCRQGAGGNEKRQITWNYFGPSWGVDWVCMRPFSWMDKPRTEEEVPARLEGFGIGDDEWPREEHMPMVDGIKRAVREVLEGGEGVADAVERVLDEEPGLIHTVWRKLREVEREKAFFAGTVLRLVEGLRGTLKEVAVVGTGDREWMRAVSELCVFVRAQGMDDMEQDDGGWVIFEPLFEGSKKSAVCAG